MPTTIHNPSDEASHPDYSRLDKDQSSTKPRTTNPQQSDKEQSTTKPPATNSQPLEKTLPYTPKNAQQPESRSTTSGARPTRHDSLDAKRNSERGSRKNSSDTLSSNVTTIATATATTISQRVPTPSTDPHKAPSGLSNSNPEATSDGDSSGSFDLLECAHAVQDPTSVPSSNPSRSSRAKLAPPSQPSYAQVTHTSKDSQQHKGTTEDTSDKGSASHHHSDRRPPESQVPAGHHSREEQRDRRSETNQSTQQVSGYGRGVVASLMSYTGLPTGPPQKDKYQELKEAYHRKQDELAQTRSTLQNYDRELKRKETESHNIKGHLHYVQHDNQRLKDVINGLQNELQNVHQELEDAKNLSEVRGKELLGSQVFLTKADALSISEVGEKVNALNEEIFQAAATLGEALIHKRHEVSDLDAAADESRKIVGVKITDILFTQSQKPEPEVNPLLVQVVLQILMVEFCVSKIRSWYPADSNIEAFLSAIYSQIRSAGKHRFDSKSSFA